MRSLQFRGLATKLISMRKSWLGLFFLLAASLSLVKEGPAQGPAGSGTESEARLTQVKGAVYLRLNDHSEDEFVPASVNASVEAGDQIRTGTDGNAELTLDGKSLIQIGPNSDFIIDALDRHQTEFYLGLGSLVAKIEHRLKNEQMDFRTPTCIAGIRGTELGLAYPSDGSPSKVGVFQGQVAVKSDG